MSHEPDPDNDTKLVNQQQLRLEIRALRSDLRLMIIASVALNQFLANITLPTAVSFTAIGAAILAPAIKGIFLR